MDILETIFTATKCSKADYMGFSWHLIYKNGEPIMRDGVHVKVKAADVEHAINMCKQIHG